MEEIDSKFKGVQPTSSFEDDDSDKPHIEHVLVQVKPKQYFDLYGYQSEKKIIQHWRTELQLSRQDANIKLIPLEECPPELKKDLEQIQENCPIINPKQLEYDAQKILDMYKEKSSF